MKTSIPRWTQNVFTGRINHLLRRITQNTNAVDYPQITEYQVLTSLRE
jgi:hypothetical protein